MAEFLDLLLIARISFDARCWREWLWLPVQLPSPLHWACWGHLGCHRPAPSLLPGQLQQHWRTDMAQVYLLTFGCTPRAGWGKFTLVLSSLWQHTLCFVLEVCSLRGCAYIQALRDKQGNWDLEACFRANATHTSKTPKQSVLVIATVLGKNLNLNNSYFFLLNYSGTSQVTHLFLTVVYKQVCYSFSLYT